LVFRKFLQQGPWQQEMRRTSRRAAQKGRQRGRR
jgi:hypothetical protein